jgi:hypothetical protein
MPGGPQPLGGKKEYPTARKDRFTLVQSRPGALRPGGGAASGRTPSRWVAWRHGGRQRRPKPRARRARPHEHPCCGWERKAPGRPSSGARSLPLHRQDTKSETVRISQTGAEECRLGNSAFGDWASPLKRLSAHRPRTDHRQPMTRGGHWWCDAWRNSPLSRP